MSSNVRALRSMSIESVFQNSFDRSLGEAFRGDIKLGVISGLGLGLASGLAYLTQGKFGLNSGNGPQRELTRHRRDHVLYRSRLDGERDLPAHPGLASDELARLFHELCFADALIQ
jgi:hypothetical protein